MFEQKRQRHREIAEKVAERLQLSNLLVDDTERTLSYAKAQILLVFEKEDLTGEQAIQKFFGAKPK